MSGILEGLKVVDMGHVVAMPSAGALLADWGADVIKVEPLTGDLLRGFKRFQVMDGRLEEIKNSAHWTINLLNRNKRSLAVDLKKDSGREIFVELIRRADVFLSNYELNALDKLKCDYASLSQINPRLIHGVLTGYGAVGPDKDERGFDFTAGWARAGAQYLIGEPGSPPPLQRSGMMDRVVGGFVVAGVLAAILHRDKTGEGQELQFSLYHTGVWIMADDVQAALAGLPVFKHDRTKDAPLWNSYRAKDDRWFEFAMMQTDLHWPDLCRAIGRPDLENDPRFNTMEKLLLNGEELVRILDGIFATKTRAEWEKVFKENRVIYGCVVTPQEIVADPQAIANDFYPSVNVPGSGESRLLATPVKFCQNPASVRTAAPEIGQHTEEILLDLGYTWEDIVRFKEEKAIL